MFRIARIGSTRTGARGLRASAVSCSASTAMSPLEPQNHLDPVYAAIDDRLNAVRKK